MWQDTVMNDEELARAFNSCNDELIPSDWDLHCKDDLRNVAQTQAEITWDKAYQDGQMSVVEWVECNAGLGIKTIEELNEGYTFIPIRTDKWQTRKKEWGLKWNNH